MANRSTLESDTINPMEPTPIFAQALVERCHVLLPDSPEPASAIDFEGGYYVFIKVFQSPHEAHQKAELMKRRGNAVILTRIPKGLALWVLEPDAKRIKKQVRSK